MRRVFMTAVVLTLVLGGVVAVSSWAADEPMTKTQGDAILDELRQIKKLLERQPAAPAAAGPRADELNLDRAEFQACLAKDKFKAQIEKDMTDAGLAGIGGTPSFVIGRIVGDGVEGVKVVGAQPFGVFDAKLKEALATR